VGKARKTLCPLKRNALAEGGGEGETAGGNDFRQEKKRNRGSEGAATKYIGGGGRIGSGGKCMRRGGGFATLPKNREVWSGVGKGRVGNRGGKSSPF